VPSKRLSFCRQCGTSPRRTLRILSRSETDQRESSVERTIRPMPSSGGSLPWSLYHVLLGALSPLDGVGPSRYFSDRGLVDRVEARGLGSTPRRVDDRGEQRHLLTNQTETPRAGLAYTLWHSGPDESSMPTMTLLKSIEGPSGIFSTRC